MRTIHNFPVWAVLASVGLGRDVPSNVRSFYGRITNGKCTGGTILRDGFYSTEDGPNSRHYAFSALSSLPTAL